MVSCKCAACLNGVLLREEQPRSFHPSDTLKFCAPRLLCTQATVCPDCSVPRPLCTQTTVHPGHCTSRLLCAQTAVHPDHSAPRPLCPQTAVPPGRCAPRPLCTEAAMCPVCYAPRPLCIQTTVHSGPFLATVEREFLSCICLRLGHSEAEQDKVHVYLELILSSEF